MSETKNLKLFKHNEPLETNENKFDIDLALNQNWDKIDGFAEKVNNKIIELEDKNEEQDFNLQEQNTKLESQIKKDRENMINLEVEGQSIHIEDSSDLEGQLEVLGNVEQETSIQGKNKLNLRQSNYTVSEVNVIKNNSILTLNGKMNIPENLLDTVGDMYKFIYLGKFKAGTYRFSKFIISGKYSVDNNIGIGTFACYIRKKDKTLLGEIGGRDSGGTGVTITLQEDTDLYMQIFCNAGAIFDNCVLGFQLEEGDKTTDFEQFIPNMPSPEYPSEIRAVGDNINLLENTAKTQIINGVEFTVNPDKTIKINGTATENISTDITKNFAITEQSIFSGMCDGYGYNKMIIQIQGTDYNVNIPNSTPQVLQPKDNVKVRIYIYAGTSINNAIIRPKIEKGTVATSHSEFGQGSAEIKKQNKNLFDILKYPFTNKVAYAPNGQLNYWAGYFGITEYFPVEENSNYVFSNDLNKPITYGLMFYNKNKEFISGIVENTTKFITPKNCKYIRFSIQSDTIPNKVQIEHGDKATEIVEHQEQTKILPIQKPMLEGDYFVKETDGWKEVHKWEKVILDGKENWILGKSKENYTVFYASDLLIKTTAYVVNNQTNNKSYVKSNYFLTDTTADEQWNNDKMNSLTINVSRNTNININNNIAKSVEELKLWLSKLYETGNPVEICYKLETPTKIPCTTEQIEILDELDNFQTYKPVTNITTDSIAKLRLKYIADTKTYVDNKYNGLAQQILNLAGGNNNV